MIWTDIYSLIIVQNREAVISAVFLKTDGQSSLIRSQVILSHAYS